MTQLKMVIQLDILRAGQVVRREQFDQDVIKVGKLSSSHLRLDDANVARIHAVVERGGDGRYTVIDLGSPNGTYVNGDRVTKAELKTGDELCFGDTVLRVHIERIAASALQPVAGAFDHVAGEDATVVGPAPGTEPEPQPVRAEPAARSAAPAPAPPAPAPRPEAQSAPQPPPHREEPVPAGFIRLENGELVEPFTVTGYYDDAGNYHPGFYDDFGQYHAGYGMFNDEGQWEVLQGYYDPQGEWVSTDPEESAHHAPLAAHAPQSAPVPAEPQGPSETDVYTEQYFADTGGSMLEVAMLWSDHVLAVKNFATPRTVTIGGADVCDFPMLDEEVGAASQPFVLYRDGQYSLILTRGMQGLVQRGEERWSVDEILSRNLARPFAEVQGAVELKLTSRTSARIDVGQVTLLVHFTEEQPFVGSTLAVDTQPIPYYIASTVAHALFLLMAMSMPDTAGGLELDDFDANDRFVQLLVRPEKEEEEEVPSWLTDKGADEPAAKHKGEEGQAGKKDSDQKNKELSIEGPADNEDIVLRKAQDTEVAMNSGALAVFQEQSMSSLFGSGDTTIGNQAIHALGNLTGDGIGEASGVGGIGLAGSGRGGGGISERGFGMANVGTAGRGGGGGGGSGYGREAANLGERTTREPTLVPGKPVVTGSLDREIIRRVVRQHRREITYCYETELQKNRNLAGRVTVEFTISPTGAVVSARVSDTTLNNATVENCVAQKIQRWVFPEPKGGGIVRVNYPFDFSS